MLLEDQRFLHEDLERLEQAVSDRVSEEPKTIRDRLNRDHQIAAFLNRIQGQSKRLEDLYENEQAARTREVQAIGTGDTFEEFYKQVNEIKEFHRRYPNEPVENLERVYKRKAPDEGETAVAEVDRMFSGEEAYGRYFDLLAFHEEFLNLPGVKNGRRITYLQYLDIFDVFVPPQCPVKRHDKLKDEYFRYISGLAKYLESFIKRTKPLENLERIFSNCAKEFEDAWNQDKIPGWDAASAMTNASSLPSVEGEGTGIWCPDCEKEFKNENVYKGHLEGKKHKQNAQRRQSSKGTSEKIQSDKLRSHENHHSGKTLRLRERVIAEREFTIQKLALTMQTERADTKFNVERRAGMTERERQQELDTLMAEGAQPLDEPKEDGSEDDEDHLYNPLKLPLAWDGKPIPYWLFKLHGLGVEFPCEICGNFVYMGRRAFDKHFNEPRHIYGLKCLGITNTTLFREITNIDDAVKLWNKLQEDKKKQTVAQENVVMMEDSEGNVMPEKVYYDLQKQGLV